MNKIFIAAICALAICGCVSRGMKITEGTDLTLGVKAPIDDGTFQVQFLNYLSGFRLAAQKDAMLFIEYSVCESNRYFGVIEINSGKHVDAILVPLEYLTATDKNTDKNTDKDTDKNTD